MLLDVSDDGLTIGVVPSNFIVIACDGMNLVPVIVTNPFGLLIEGENETVGVVTVNVAEGALTVSFAVTVSSPDGKPGTVNVAVKPPADVDVTVAGVVDTVVPLNFNVIV